MKRGIDTMALALVMGMASSGVALAADPTGIWLREDGKEKIKIERCDAALCGSVDWIDDPGSRAKVGQRVLSNFVASGDNKWDGKAFNPEDGNNYLGKLSLSGNALVTTGCVLGGVICKSINWTRAK